MVFLKSRWSELQKQAERSAQCIFMQIKSSHLSVHWSGESAIASLVAGQGFVTLLGLTNHEISSAQSCWKGTELSSTSTAPPQPGPPCPEPGLTSMMKPIHTGGPKEAQEHLGNPCLARSCWNQQHSLCSAGYLHSDSSALGGGLVVARCIREGFAHWWRQRHSSRGGEGLCALAVLWPVL